MEAALTKIAGVKSAKANKETKSAAVVYDSGKTSLYKIVTVFNKDNGGGYKALMPKSPKTKS